MDPDPDGPKTCGSGSPTLVGMVRYGTCDRIELDVGGSRHLRPVARPKGRGGSSAKAGACRETKGLAHYRLQ
jgi:hypothetical protein